MDEAPKTSSYRHDAFISYSRRDREFAARLEKALEAFRIPKDLPVPNRRLEIFRDEVDFTGVEYHQSLARHLQESGKLIVVCSPHARRSAYVNDEIRRFVQAQGAARLVPVLLSGLPNNEAGPGQEEEKAFPDALCEALPMPLPADFRQFNPRVHQPNASPYAESWYKLLADLFDLSRREIEQRDRKRRIRRRRVLVATVTAIFLALSSALVLALISRQEAVRQRQQAKAQRDVALKGLARYLASQADASMVDNPSRSLLLSVEAVNATRLVDGTTTAVAEQALHDVLAASGGRSIQDVTEWKFLGNGARLAAKGFRGEVQIVDVAGRFPSSRTLPSPDFKAVHLAVSRDGQWVAAANVAPGGIRLWNVARLEDKPSVLAPGSGAERILKFSPDGQWLLSDDTNAVLNLWRVDGSRTEPIRLSGHGKNRKRGGIWSADFSPDGHFLLSAGEDKTVRLWNLQEPTEAPQILFESPSSFLFPRFSEDGRWLAMSRSGTTNTWNASVLLWKLEGTRATRVELGHDTMTGKVDLLREAVIGFVPSRPLFLTAASGEVCLWNLADLAHPVRRWPAYRAVFSPSDETLALVTEPERADGEHVLRVWNLRENSERESMECGRFRSRLDELQFSPDGRHLMAVESEGKAWLVDASAQIDPILLPRDVGGRSTLGFSPDSQWLVLSSWREGRVWRVSHPGADPTRLNDVKASSELEYKSSSGGGGGEPRGGLPGAIAFDPGNQWLAVPGHRGPAYLISLEDPGSVPFTLEAREERAKDVTAMAFTPDGKWLAAGDWNYGARIWKAGNAASLAMTLKAPDDGTGSSVSAMAFSADGRWLATGGSVGKVALWDMQQPDQPPRMLGSGRDWITSLEFDGRDGLLASAGESGQLQLWNVTQPGSQPRVLTSAAEPIRALFAGQGRWIASASRDGAVRFWNLTNLDAAPLVMNAHRGGAHGLAGSRDGRWLVSAGEDFTLRLWDCRDPGRGGEPFGEERTIVNVVAVSPDNSLVAAGDVGGVVRVWRMTDLARTPVRLADGAVDQGRGRGRGRGSGVWAMQFSPDGRYLAAMVSGQVRLWRMRLDEQLELACAVAGHNLSLEEWEMHLGGTPYRPTCEPFGLPPDFLSTATNLAKLGHVERATAVFLRARELQPELRIEPAAVSVQLAVKQCLLDGRQLAYAGGTNAAMAELTRMLRLTPGTNFSPAAEVDRVLRSRSRVEEGTRLARSGDLTNAALAFRQAMELNPGLEMRPVQEAGRFYAPILERQAQALAEAGRLDEATSQFERVLSLDAALEFDPRQRASGYRAETLAREAYQKARRGEFDAAVRLYREVVQLSPGRIKDPEAEARRAMAPFHVERGQALIGKRQYAEAMAAFLQALEGNPSERIFPGTWNELCWQGSKAGAATQVLEAGNRAVKAEPDNGAYRDSRGVARALTGQIAGAIEDFKVYVEWAPGQNRSAEEIEERKGWIKALEAGSMPKSFEELQAMGRKIKQ